MLKTSIWYSHIYLMYIVLTLYILTSVCIFSTLLLIPFLMYWKGEFVCQSKVSFSVDHNHKWYVELPKSALASSLLQFLCWQKIPTLQMPGHVTATAKFSIGQRMQHSSHQSCGWKNSSIWRTGKGKESDPTDASSLENFHSRYENE